MHTPHTYRPHFGEPFLAAVGTLIVHVFTLQSDYSQRKARDELLYLDGILWLTAKGVSPMTELLF